MGFVTRLLMKRLSVVLLWVLFGAFFLAQDVFAANVSISWSAIIDSELTGYKFYYPLSVFGDDIFYEELQNSTVSDVTGNNYYPQWKWEYQIACDSINKNESMLDIS